MKSIDDASFVLIDWLLTSDFSENNLRRIIIHKYKWRGRRRKSKSLTSCLHIPCCYNNILVCKFIKSLPPPRRRSKSESVFCFFVLLFYHHHHNTIKSIDRSTRPQHTHSIGRQRKIFISSRVKKNDDRWINWKGHYHYVQYGIIADRQYL